MSEESFVNDEAGATSRLDNLVSAWNNASFESYSKHFTQSLVDHYNPTYFARIRASGGRWLSNQYLGALNQGHRVVHLWRSRFESTQNDVLFSLSLTADGHIAGLLKRMAGV
jgi:hypothetical protein